MPAGLSYLLPQTPLLFKYAYWLNAAARWMLAGALHPACKLMLCFSICHTCWYGVSLSAVPAGVMPHYFSCLLMWCLTISPVCFCDTFSIGRAFWCGASLQAIIPGVVPHYRPCLLVWYLIINSAYLCLPHFRPCLLVWYLIINYVYWCFASL